MSKQGWVILSCFWIAACSADSNPSPSVAASRTCGGTWELTGTGVGDFRVGLSVDDVRAKCEVLFDTTLQFGNEGQPERRLGVRVGTDTLQATIENGRVWRIEVRSPTFKTSDSVGVGSTVRELAKQPVDFFGYGEGGPFVGLSNHCGLSLQLAGVPPVARSLKQVPRGAKVDLILIIGC
jgi:hypothetical protein